MKKIYSESFGQGPNIVLLHGWATHSGIWQFITSKLAENFRVTLIDLPGFGRSAMIPDYSLDNIVDHLLEITPAKATWLGWSLGGLVATKAALSYPERVTNLICVASSPKFCREKNWPGMELSLLHKFNEQLNSDYEDTLRKFFLLQFYGLTVNKEMIRWLNQNMFLYGKPSVQTLRAGLKLLEHEDLRAQLSHIRCPILYMFGKMDALVPVGIGERLSEIKSDIQCVVLPKASHALFLSHEIEFLNEVKRFIYEA